MQRLVMLACLICLGLAAACSTSKSEPPSSTARAGATRPPDTTAVLPAATTTPAVASLSDFSLVYVDTSKGQGGEVYVASSEGASPRKVAPLPNGTRALDARGNVLVAAGNRDILVIDLKTGVTRNTQSPNQISFGGFVDERSLLLTTYSGCGPPNGSNATITKLDTTSLQLAELAKPNGRTLGIAGIDTASNQAAIILRGCDVGVHDIAVYSLADGKLVSTIVADGCGGAGVDLARKRALVGLRACSPLPGHGDADFSLIDLTSATPTVKDIKFPTGQANNQSFLMRPGLAQVAAGGQTPATTPGPGFRASSTGIWLIDLMTGSFSSLVPADGGEQWPVAWSPDGRYLLYATVRAQGNCDYAYIDLTSRQTRPIAKEITFCGANGEVLGWSLIK